MVNPAMPKQPLPLRLFASARRFFRWLTAPHVLLSLIMLVVLFYMVVIPLYRTVHTTLTLQSRDLTRFPSAVIGDFSLYHYVRMLTGDLGQISMHNPLKVKIA